MARLILLVEDDPMVASMLMTAMESWGFAAIRAASADEAIALAEIHQHEIGMMICDVLLPGQPGPVVAGRVRSICPNVKTCFTSGYTPDILNQKGLLTSDLLQDSSVTYLQKPFLPRTVREIIVRAMKQPEPLAEASSERILYGTAAC